MPASEALVANFRQRVEDVQKQLVAAFPDAYSKTKETIRRDLEQMKEAIRK